MKAACEPREQSCLWTGSGKGEADTGSRLGDARSNLDQAEPQSRELSRGERLRVGDGITQPEHEPLCPRMEDEADLIGQRRAATGAIRSKLRVVQLDEVLGLATLAVQTVIEPFGIAAWDVGDGVANIEPSGCGFDARYDTMLAAPGLGTVTRFGIAAHDARLLFRPPHPHIIGRRLDQAVQHGVAGQAEDCSRHRWLHTMP